MKIKVKNKSKTYILLAVVLLIWGIVGYKLISALNPEAVPQQTAANYEVAFKPKNEIIEDTFTLKGVERDPFLGKMIKPEKEVKKKITGIKKSISPVPEKQLAFSGTVSDKTSKEKIFFIQIDGVQQLMSPGQIINGVKLISGNEQQVIVSSNGKRKVIKRN